MTASSMVIETFKDLCERFGELQKVPSLHHLARRNELAKTPKQGIAIKHPSTEIDLVEFHLMSPIIAFHVTHFSVFLFGSCQAIPGKSRRLQAKCNS